MSNVRGRLRRLEQRAPAPAPASQAKLEQLSERLRELVRGQADYLVARPLAEQQEPTWYAWPRSERFEHDRAVAAVCYLTAAPAGSVALSEADIAELQRVGVTLILVEHAVVWP